MFSLLIAKIASILSLVFIQHNLKDLNSILHKEKIEPKGSTFISNGSDGGDRTHDLTGMNRAL